MVQSRPQDSEGQDEAVVRARVDLAVAVDWEADLGRAVEGVVADGVDPEVVGLVAEVVGLVAVLVERVAVVVHKLF